MEPKRKERMKKAQKSMIQVLSEQLGNVSIACQQVGISRQAHYNWLKNNQRYREAIEEIPEKTIDFVEHSLLKNVKAGNVVAQIFYLKTKAKHRGYVEKQEIEHSNKEGIRVIIDERCPRINKATQSTTNPE